VSNINIYENSLTTLIPEKLARKYNVFPLEIDDGNLIVEIADENIYALQDIGLVTGMNVILKKQDIKIISEKIDKNYKNTIQINEDYARNLFERLLKIAIQKNVSDIHIEPFKNYLSIRMRIDGDLKENSRHLIDVHPLLLNVVKIRAFMDIAEKRLPQDGRIDTVVEGKVIDIRVSSIPTVYGEKVVLRILNRDLTLMKKENLGFSKNAIKIIEKIVSKRAGILIITGPTGSGKTTTLYSILNDLKKLEKNITTIEDPVEYKIEGINQIQVNTKIGLTFEVGLRSILRQDPDIIMIGEIRDLETAKIAIRAAITGHLVISTMHTSDAISSISRLLEMQIPPYLINASLIGVISQRLVKKISQGRTIIYEILEINDEIREGIQNFKEDNSIREIAIKNKMITFEDSYKEKVEENIIEGIFYEYSL
jgi:type IV pilus assembly protein PilB